MMPNQAYNLIVSSLSKRKLWNQDKCRTVQSYTDMHSLVNKILPQQHPKRKLTRAKSISDW